MSLEEIFQLFNNIPELQKDIFSLLDSKPEFYKEKDFKQIFNKAYTYFSKNSFKFIKQEFEEQNTENIVFDYDLSFNKIIFAEDMNFISAETKSLYDESTAECKFFDDLCNALFQTKVPNLNKYSEKRIFLFLVMQFSLKLIEKSAFIPEIIDITCPKLIEERSLGTITQDLPMKSLESFNLDSNEDDFSPEIPDTEALNRCLEKINIIQELNQNENAYRIRWIPFLKDEKVKEAFDKLLELLPEGFVEFEQTSPLKGEYDPQPPERGLLRIYCPEILDETGHLKYNKELIQYAQENRNNPTKAEKKIWEEILSNKKLNHKFRQQKIILNFILDFYCTELLLGIEIDGEYHINKQLHDEVRSEELEKYLIKIIRYTNEQVLNNIEFIKNDLLKQIDQRIEELNLLNKNLSLKAPFQGVGGRTQKVIKEAEKQSLFFLISSFIKYFIKTEEIKDSNEINNFFFANEILWSDESTEHEIPGYIYLWLEKLHIKNKNHQILLEIDEIIDKETDEINFSLNFFIEYDKHGNKYKINIKDLSLEVPFQEIVELEALESEIKGTDLESFLSEQLPLLKYTGIKVALPKSLKNLVKPQLALLAGTNEDINENTQIAKVKSLSSLERIANFNWGVNLGDDDFMPTEEFFECLANKKGLVKIKDKFIYIQDKDLEKLRQNIISKPLPKKTEIIKALLAEEYNDPKIKINNALKANIDNLLEIPEEEKPITLQAELRPYQKRGFDWLYRNAKMKIGSLMADDMGLGKTLQLIALCLKLKNEGALNNKPALIVLPTTLLTNWEKEIAKFAPSLRVQTYHGSNRNFSLNNLENIDILLTTYGIIRKEYEKFSNKFWSILILDEAQNIKNISSSQTKAIKKLSAEIKIAATGTPIENCLAEYWSIFDFLNDNYLGNWKEFKENYAMPIELNREQEKLKKLKKITNPFILRRLKSDKSIIRDLPEKIEIDQYCNLGKEQRFLYEKAFNQVMSMIENTEQNNIERKGLILKLITVLKQVCNHPSQYLKDYKAKSKDSGKAIRLLELIDSIESRAYFSKTLIFTQYTEMGNILSTMLEQERAIRPLFLHGGLSRKERDKIVETFQNENLHRVLILSLKAGGVGLNLTSADNVIHYDLWWNPAIEMQATDRAYRIGQRRDVIVHRLICENTFEERINEILKDKRDLADAVLPSGEKYLMSLSNQDLRGLFSL